MQKYFIMRNFENWETQDLEIEFGLYRNFKSQLLEEWLQATTTLNEYEMQRADKLKDKIFKFSDYWNEDELKMQAISPIIDLVDYNADGFTVFSNRPLSAKINGIELGGRVDFLISKGQQKPIPPYFFIHEYKQETKKGSSDPKGQLLSELLVAQERNKEANFPIYGCYVVGRSWFFVVLQGKEYAVTNAINASDDDIVKVIAMLRQVRLNIFKILNKN